MIRYVELKLGGEDVKAFFNNDFSIANAGFVPLHKHKYGEIHIIVSGEMKYYIEEKEFLLKRGMAIFIPAKNFHRFLYEGNAEFVAFQTDIEESDVKNCTLSLHTFESFVKLMKEKNNNKEKVVPYFYWIISELISNIQVLVKENSDYSYLIYEYFGNHYNENISLSDLAAALHLSEKQTQRIIKRETGNTFLKELTYYRIKIAKYMVDAYNMPLSRAAEYVGYNSYSGFWKAYNKYNKS